MAKIEASVMVDRPAEEVWIFVTNPSNTPKWAPTVIDVKQTSAGSLGVGSTIEWRRRLYPHVQPFKVSEYEPNRRFSMEFTRAPMKGSKLCFDVETAEGKTRLNLEWDTEYHGLGKLFGPLITRSAKKEMAFVDNIRRTIESEAKS